MKALKTKLNFKNGKKLKRLAERVKLILILAL